MFRKTNKDKSISEIVVYSIILTWFAVILVENWQYMRLSWFKEVWEFADFKTIVHYIDEYLGICVVLGAAIIVLYKLITLFARAEGDEGVSSERFEEPEDSSADYIAKLRAKWDADVTSSPDYSYRYDNIFYRDFHRHKSDHH